MVGTMMTTKHFSPSIMHFVFLSSIYGRAMYSRLHYQKFVVCQHRSPIHGRGLFCLRNIDAGEMVIEYSGQLIRSVLTDKREKYYESKVCKTFYLFCCLFVRFVEMNKESVFERDIFSTCSDQQTKRIQSQPSRWYALKVS